MNDRDQFWQIIDASRARFDARRRDGNSEIQLRDLRELLTRLSARDVLQFDGELAKKMSDAFRWDLWGVAYIIGGGCSDDSFSDFRSWLISMGRDVFEDALKSPESVSAYIRAPGVEDLFFEEFQYLPAQVYEQMTGREVPPRKALIGKSPVGDRWKEEELPHLFPKVWAAIHRR